MPWQKGNKEYVKRRVSRGGRPIQSEIELLEVARKRVIGRLAKDTDGIYHDWRKLVRKHPASANYAMDKILGDEQAQTPGAVFIAIQAGGDQSQSHVRADGLQIRIGGSNGDNGDGGEST